MQPNEPARREQEKKKPKINDLMPKRHPQI